MSAVAESRPGVGIALSLVRMIGSKRSFADAIAIVEPGVVTGELKRAAASRTFYPPDPASFEHCTIGGNVATNAGGPRCLNTGYPQLRDRS